MEELTKCFKHSFKEAFEDACDKPSCPCHRPEQEGWEKQASEATDAFLSILEPWFHPDGKWEKVEALANEFLYEDLRSRFKSLLENQMMEERKPFGGLTDKCTCKCHDKFTYKSHGACCVFEAGRTAAYKEMLEKLPQVTLSDYGSDPETAKEIELAIIHQVRSLLTPNNHE